MFDPAQILLFIIIIVLMILLVVLGIEVFLVLKDIRKTLVKVNKVLDDSGEITDAIKGPVTGFSGAIMGLKTGNTILNLFNKVASSSNKEDKHHHGK